MIKSFISLALFIFLIHFSLKLNAQLGFCTGNSGDPIFVENFGAGTATVSLPAGTTTYTFVADIPFDGDYTVSSNTNHFDWHDIMDHTPGDTNGRSLIVNADFTAGEFYKTTINDLCENTTYEFSSWMINLQRASGCERIGIPINVRFEIWDDTDTNILASGDTGDIENTQSPNWRQYALVFKTLSNQSSVILKMSNNGVGGCGNDLALDDIVFKSCGDAVAIKDSLNNLSVSLCEDEVPYSTQLTAIPDFSIFSTHFYQWQESTDGATWVDIIAETNQTYNVPSITTSRFYRVKVSENIFNLNNALCNSSSEIFEIRVVSFPDAPVSRGDLNICEGDTTPLRVNVSNGVVINWYDAPVGGNLLLAKKTIFNPVNSGVYYAEAETIMGGCLSASRTAVEVVFWEAPQVQDETLEFCKNTTKTLRSNEANSVLTIDYLWNNGATTESIDVSTPGTYTVDVANANCTVTKTITLTQIDSPVIDTVKSDGRNIVITTVNTGDFQYSINGSIFQPSNVFENVKGGEYTISVKGRNCSDIVKKSFIHFYIPKFFTPNNDGFYDTFDLKGIEFFRFSRVSIFDRYGKLLKNAVNSSLSWDGTFNNQLLSRGDYWYIIVLNDQKITGHFTLKH